ncbi:hypothetical protein ES703_61917 [subsurface metagenome]
MRVFSSICNGCRNNTDVISVVSQVNTTAPLFGPLCIECVKKLFENDNDLDSLLNTFCKGCDKETDVISMACQADAIIPFFRPFCIECIKKMFENDNDFEYEDYMSDIWNES